MAALSLKKKTQVDMTQGAILPMLISFAFPLLIGNLFQQLYNTVDTWVVGNYVGKNSFSAVGTLSPVTNLMIGFFMGFSTGAAVLIAQYFGAKDDENVSRTTHTFVGVTIIMCILSTIVGILLIPLLLNILKSPAEVAAEQRTYLFIYFAGITGLLIYNMGAAILRAIGNSTDPFIFLVVSAVLNIILDLVFVIAFHMGTAGVALATVISQGVSAILVIITLLRTKTCVRVSIRKIHIHSYILKNIFRIGIPSGLQLSITAFANVFAQSYINYFGADVMGGYTAYSKVDQFLFMPSQSITLGAQTFVGQNLGMRQTERARKGVRTSILMALTSVAVLILFVELFATDIVKVFIDSNESGVIYYGTMMLHYITPFYIVTTFNQIYAGALRGAGKSTSPMLIMIFCFVIFRQIYLFVMANFISNTVLPIVLGYPAGWVLCSIILSIAYFRNFSDEKLKKSTLV
ncbi:MAG: MATE family efflux transporter [Sphaerochaetaceae bacterium]|nr:MATE family efflux transporter [Sphaerochaetaceae bacterium]